MSKIATILLIDDDPVQLAILDAYFTGHGTKKILKAVNGFAALAIIGDQTEPIDLILCDLKMPEMDGIEFMRYLKDSSYDGPIAILSSADRYLIESAEKLATIHGLDVVGTLRKPMSREKLDKLVADIDRPATIVPATVAPKIDRVYLRQAIDDGLIIPFYQPKTEVATHNVVGVEALARWIHPELGIIAPDIFIPVAEEEGLIESLTTSMISSCISDAKTWNRLGIKIKISINVTSAILKNVTFPDRFLAQVHEAGVDRTRFVFEVTESGVLDADASTMEVLARLRIKDIDLSIDDFGTGYSNIEQLRNIPYCELKIDQSFIANCLDDKFSRASVTASVALGRELNMRLVAEGVETQEQWDYVAAQGIDQVQGFLIAKAMPAEEFQNWYLERGGKVDLAEPELSDSDLYAPLIAKGAA